MIGNNRYSIWGIKDSGEDITNEILSILNNANSFIIVGGYNFTFKTAGYSFFRILQNKVRQGIPVLMIIPSNLTGYNNSQPAIINFCITNGIGLILNGNNHSKWLMTENDLYYGSSNFTETSWRQRIEVVTIHRHNNLYGSWKRRTLLDFRLFIQREISKINRRPTMNAIPGLIANTIAVWNRILPLVLRLNPSIEKVIYTLRNYGEVETLLNENIEEWFQLYDIKLFKQVYEYNANILKKYNDLCDFAYSNIYNETTENREFRNEDIINEYNFLHSEFVKTIERATTELRDNETLFSEISFQTLEENLNVLKRIEINISNTDNYE
ncbi:hypothetical protein SAMN05444285_10689 [Draconibacterium orientale]|uniref:PLD phosphodiesterase domain-containing protein n=1 Tax=Draconibacterium orientale TaxID=1168034 RepID=X5DEX4_9BACT|nr:phospholipase D-like domain-containing protein [Draconibacterium orientale]AHW61453.1 hypothetical protein FH5T_01340 [Draconibacterium orientale]SET12341.1 hypothetical protein SAMN05444285_10689 [Draconibacterium orientale]